MAIITGTALAAFLGETATADHDATAKAVERWIKNRNGRDYERAQRTEWPLVDSNTLVSSLRLRESDIASIDEVRIDISGVFPDSTIVQDLTRFVVVDPLGDEVLYRYGFFYPGPRRAQFLYTAGWWPIDDVDVLHVGPRVANDFYSMLLNVAAVVVDQGERKEVFSNVREGQTSYTRYENALASCRLSEIADLYKRW